MSTSPSQPNVATTEQAPLVEQREFPRYPIVQRCIVWPPDAGGSDGWHCIAYNISLTGIGLTLPTPLREGTILEIKPWGLPAARPLRAEVIHTKAVAFLWFCGCRFITPLNEKELQAWLAGPLHWVPEDQPDYLS